MIQDVPFLAVFRNFGNYEEIRKNEQSYAAGQPEGNIPVASNKYSNQDEELDKSQDIHIDHRNITQLQSNSNITDSINENNDVYTSTASNSVAQLQEQPQKQNFNEQEVKTYIDSDELLLPTDPSLAETTRLLKNLREEYDEYQCSACQCKEAMRKNSTKPLFCPKCKSKSLMKKED